MASFSIKVVRPKPDQPECFLWPCMCSQWIKSKACGPDCITLVCAVRGRPKPIKACGPDCITLVCAVRGRPKPIKACGPDCILVLCMCSQRTKSKACGPDCILVLCMCSQRTKTKACGPDCISLVYVYMCSQRTKSKACGPDLHIGLVYMCSQRTKSKACGPDCILVLCTCAVRGPKARHVVQTAYWSCVHVQSEDQKQGMWSRLHIGLVYMCSQRTIIVKPAAIKSELPQYLAAFNSNKLIVLQ